MKPSIGRIVHFVTNEGDHLPAIIVKVLPVAKDHPGDLVALRVFSYQNLWRPSVNHQEPVYVGDEMQPIPRADPETWHWPEREE